MLATLLAALTASSLVSAQSAANQAYNNPTDFAADRNSPLGQTFTHTFCP